MAYSRIKTWIPGEILTASDLNAEHDGHITNEDDLDTRLTAEVAARVALEAEYDAHAALYGVLDKLWTYRNTAPSGWNIVASTTDALLACKGGSNAYNTTGGQQIGTWTISGISVNNHTLVTSEIPAHTHTTGSREGNFYGANSTIQCGANPGGAYRTTTSSSVGSGAGHDHNLTIGSAYRPLANLGIIIEKT